MVGQGAQQKIVRIQLDLLNAAVRVGRVHHHHDVCRCGVNGASRRTENPDLWKRIWRLDRKMHWGRCRCGSEGVNRHGGQGVVADRSIGPGETEIRRTELVRGREEDAVRIEVHTADRAFEIACVRHEADVDWNRVSVSLAWTGNKNFWWMLQGNLNRR